MTRRLLDWEGDTGAYLRTALEALASIGILPEERWPYDEATFDDEPDAIDYAIAGNFKALDYTRLDRPGIGGDAILLNLKHVLSARFTAVFGFSVYNSISSQADVPYPTRHDKLIGGPRGARSRLRRRSRQW